jgi:alpha-L-rhamnosidase
LEGCVFHSDAPVTARFECSNTTLNKIWNAIDWTLRGNLHSVPTDCPQRDERLGWTGDIQVFSQTAIFLRDMEAFFGKFLRDMREAQTEDGRFPDFAPHPFDNIPRFSGNPGWADAGAIVPWNCWVNYGDRRILEAMFEPARRWVEHTRGLNGDLIWRNNFCGPVVYGDWLSSDTWEMKGFAKTGGAMPNEVYGTAFFAQSTRLLAKMAGVLGKTEAAAHYDALADDIVAAFQREFVSEDGKITGDTQGGYALALHFGLLPAHLEKAAAAHLVAALEPFHGHLSTGIQSTVRAMLQLSKWGYNEQAYRLITSTTVPSWGYMVEGGGGTTIWERWDGWVEGRGFANEGMNSFNHYAIGAVGEWMARVIGGLSPDENAPAWEHFNVCPLPGGGLQWANFQYDSPRGRIDSSWRFENEVFHLQLTVPPNTSATVTLPGKNATEAGRPLSAAPGIEILSLSKNETTAKVEAGQYQFAATFQETM